MTEEEIKALVEEKDKLVKENAENAQAVANLTSEIKTVRTQKQEAERIAKEKADALTAQNDDATNPEAIVNRLLSQKEKEALANSKDEAEIELKEMFPEFSEANDQAGIALDKFKSEAKKFNFDGLKTKDQILKRYKEVHEFMNRKAKQEGDSTNIHAGTSQHSTGDVKAVDANTLSDKEKKLIKSSGWTNEKYIQVKAKRPQYIASLLKYVS